MAIVMLIRSMVDGVILCTHDGSTRHMNIIVNIRCPHSSSKQKQLMRQEMHRNVEQGPCIRQSLQNAIDRMESKACKWTQCVLFVVFVVNVMEEIVPRLDIVEKTMLPVDKELYAGHVESEIKDVTRQTNV